MSAEREALIRDAFAAWSRGDLEAAIVAFHPDVVWHFSGIFPDYTGVLRGHDDIRGFWRSFTEPWERIEIEAEGFRHVGDWTVVTLRFCAIGRDGVRVELPQAHACRFRDGLVVEYTSHRDPGEALAAIGAA